MQQQKNLIKRFYCIVSEHLNHLFHEYINFYSRHIGLKRMYMLSKCENFCNNHWQSNQLYNWSVMASSITQFGRAKFTKFSLISFTHSCKLGVICWTGTFYPLPDYVIGIKRNRFFLKTYFSKKWIDLDSMGDFNFFFTNILKTAGTRSWTPF